MKNIFELDDNTKINVYCDLSQFSMGLTTVSKFLSRMRGISTWGSAFTIRNLETGERVYFDGTA
jgi:hypothetical protein